MFSLIVTVMSIALVAAVLIASIYYGGDAYQQYSSKNSANMILNQSVQIIEAKVDYLLDNQSNPVLISDLSPDYLTSMPNPSSVTDANWEFTSSGHVILEGVSHKLCTAINEMENSNAPEPIINYDDFILFEQSVHQSPRKIGCNSYTAGEDTIYTFFARS